ncbi:MAG: FG-GAP repeat domain-containing protein, partial [Cyanobacteriota bacterium]
MAQLLLIDYAATFTSLVQALELVENRLAAWASDTDAYNALLLEVFGVESSTPSHSLQAVLSGNGLGIAVELLEGSNLPGIRGSYTSSASDGQERIYLNHEWLLNASTAAIESVLLEELGHAIDYRLNGSNDTVGDEGEIFAAHLLGQRPSSTASSEDDQNLITIGGMAVAIEASGDITYAPPITNPFGITDAGYSASPTFADVDTDGDLDLFIGNWYGNTVFYRNTAAAGATAPAYASPITNPFGITDVGYHASPTFADIDGDRDLDLFIGTTYGTTDFYRNTAAAGATAPAYDLPITNPFGISLVNNNSSPTFVDVDLDGDLDLFAGDWLGETFFFRNIATSAFTDPSFGEPIVCPFGITDVGYSAKPAFADADTDGDLDLFIGDGYGNTVFYRNTAAAVATAPAYASPITNPFGITDVGYAASPTFGDVDGDRDFDLFIGTSYGNTVFFRNTTVTSPPIIKITSINPNGIYGIGAVITLNAQFSKAVFVNTALGSPTLALETGMKDHVATYVNGSGTNTLVFQYIVQAGDHAPILDQLSANALSLNGSIILDAAGNIPSLTLAEAGTIGSLSANKNLAIDGTNPTGSTPGFIRTGLSYVGSDVGPNASPAFADVDTDGDLDLFIGNWYGNTVFYRNTAAAGATAPAYASPITNPFGINNVAYYSSPDLADVDTDGDLDLFIGEWPGNTVFYRNTAAAGATAPAYASPITNPFGITDVGWWSSPDLADVDTDGDLDLFIGVNDGNTVFYRNTAAAGATAPAYASPITNPFGITYVGSMPNPAFADVDTDGDLDLLIGDGEDRDDYDNTVFFLNSPIIPITSSNSNGSYGIGSVITLTLQFSEPVFVNTSLGTPTLALETGTTDRAAVYDGGSGSTTL